MPVVKVWGIPANETQENLNDTCTLILQVMSGIYELRLDKSDITVLFPKDMMLQGLGEEIIIEICGLFKKAGRTQTIIDALASYVGKSVKARYPNSKVECFVYMFEPSQGFYSS